MKHLSCNTVRTRIPPHNGNTRTTTLECRLYHNTTHSRQQTQYSSKQKQLLVLVIVVPVLQKCKLLVQNMWALCCCFCLHDSIICVYTYIRRDASAASGLPYIFCSQFNILRNYSFNFYEIEPFVLRYRK